MMVDVTVPEGIRVFDPDLSCGCVWVEDRLQKIWDFSHVPAAATRGQQSSGGTEQAQRIFQGHAAVDAIIHPGVNLTIS